MNFDVQVQVRYVTPGFLPWLIATGYYTRSLAALEKMFLERQRRARRNARKRAPRMDRRK